MPKPNSHLYGTRSSATCDSGRKPDRHRRGFVPERMCLEDRLLLDASKPAGSLRQDPEVASFLVSPRQGSLRIQGTSDADTVAIGRSARGFVTVTIDGVVRSGDLRDRAAFDRRLAGLRVDRIRAVQFTGDDPRDTVVLNTALGNGRAGAVVQSQAVTIAAPVNHAGTLRIEAQAVTIAAI